MLVPMIILYTWHFPRLGPLIFFKIYLSLGYVRQLEVIYPLLGYVMIFEGWDFPLMVLGVSAFP